MHRLPVRKVRIGPPRRGPERDPGYLRWLHTLPCIVCGTHRRIEAAHVGERGFGQKCSDRQALPLCETHHRTGQNAVHVIGKRFWVVFGLDRHRLIKEHNRMFEEGSRL